MIAMLLISMLAVAAYIPAVHVTNVNAEGTGSAEAFKVVLAHLRDEISGIQDMQTTYEQTIARQQARIDKLEDEVRSLKNRGVIESGSDVIQGRQVTAGPQTRFSFTAYLDHRLTSLTRDETIIFNEVLNNEGGAYNEQTGIFTAQMPGTYLFTWAVTARKLAGGNAYDIWVKLMVNGNHQTGAVAESRADADDNQGSNTAIIGLNEGDTVWIAHYSSYPQLHGDNLERTTSFAGVLLYSNE